MKLKEPENKEKQQESSISIPKWVYPFSAPGPLDSLLCFERESFSHIRVLAQASVSTVTHWDGLRNWHCGIVWFNLRARGNGAIQMRFEKWNLWSCLN